MAALAIAMGFKPIAVLGMDFAPSSLLLVVLFLSNFPGSHMRLSI
jgi:hypothetical protein